jgi:NTE family protein
MSTKSKRVRKGAVQERPISPAPAAFERRANGQEGTMNQRRIAIACQGGGSQCAFVAGVLRTFMADGVQDRFKIVALSGTSGGAITAALAWYGLLEQARGDGKPIEDRILGFWRDLTAQTPQEMLLDGWCAQIMRLTESGILPTIASSPSSPQFRFWTQVMIPMMTRPQFTDLGTLVRRHLDFDALPSLVEPDSPVLLVGAADVLQGAFKVFSSARQEIKAEALLASASIPNLFPATWVDGNAYWDGIFSANPPIVAFLRKALMGKESLPDEIWIIQVNRAHYDSIPEKPAEIFDRRNQLAGNLSLRHELQMIEMVNLLIQEHALTDGFRARFGVDTARPITVRFVRMSPELSEGLDYPSKLSRQPSHIDKLIAEGEAQGRTFLAELQEAEASPAFGAKGPSVETH